MKRKILYLFIAVCLLHVIHACCKPRDRLYDWIEIRSDNLDNSQDVPTISQNDSILKEAYGIRLELVPERVYVSANWPLINTAYASKCNDNFTPRSIISKVQIFTLEKFDNNHNINSEITEYFGARDVGDNYHLYYEIDDYLLMLNRRIEDSQRYPNYDLELYLLQAPDNVGYYRFVIQISFSNQQALRDTVAVNLY